MVKLKVRLIFHLSSQHVFRKQDSASYKVGGRKKIISQNYSNHVIFQELVGVRTQLLTILVSSQSQR